MTPFAVFLLFILAMGGGLLVAEVRGRVLAHRRRVRRAEVYRAMDEAVAVAMGRHPSRPLGPEDDPVALAGIAERARRGDVR